MRHENPKRRNPYEMLAQARAAGWNTVETIPLAGEGEFLVLTLSGLERLAKNRKTFRNHRKADGHGPERTNVISVKTGNYLAAIAWRWPDDT